MEHPGNGISFNTTNKWTWKDIEAHEKIQRNFKGTLPSERSQSEKTTYCMIPSIWQHRKGKTQHSNKHQWLSGISRETGVKRQAEDRGSLGHWNYFVWYHNGGYMSFIYSSKPIECAKPRVTNYELWVKKWCLSVGSLMITKVPLCMIIMEEAMHISR